MRIVVEEIVKEAEGISRRFALMDSDQQEVVSQENKGDTLPHRP
jgi:hypothetical protein